MNRRGFLARLAGLAAAPLVVEPTLEEVARLGWRRKFFPGWAPASPANVYLPSEFLTREILLQLESELAFARQVNRYFAAEFERDRAFYSGDEWAPRAGSSLYLRKPSPFPLS